jgi:hypothetical protein
MVMPGKWLHRSIRATLLVTVVAIAGLWVTQGTAMANRVIFSQVTGTVLDNGKPVAGAVIERQFEWNNEKLTDTATTGAQGGFSLPPVTRQSSFMDRLLPSEPMVKQTILIKHAGRAYKAWFHFKRNYDDNGEIGRPIQMTCRLEREPERHGEVFGICELT